MSLAFDKSHNPAGSHGSDEARDTDGTAHRRIVRALKAIVFDGLIGLGNSCRKSLGKKNGERWWKNHEKPGNLAARTSLKE